MMADLLDEEGADSSSEDEGDESKGEWVEYLLEQWERCNPRKSGRAKSHIPLKIHWI